MFFLARNYKINHTSSQGERRNARRNTVGPFILFRAFVISSFRDKFLLFRLAWVRWIRHEEQAIG